jgi:hypothetical protein
MEKKRELELLAYAKVCFDKCTSLFETIHLSKKKITADECRDLSFEIGSIIEDALSDYVDKLPEGFKEIREALEQAEREFAETQT